MQEIKYNNAIVRIRGEVKREKIEEVTLVFLKKIEKCRKNKKKEKNQNDNCDKSRDFTEE